MTNRKLQFAILRGDFGRRDINEILLDLINILGNMDKEYTEDIDELKRKIDQKRY